MRHLNDSLRRPAALIAALGLLFFMMQNGIVLAGQVQQRSIKMSDNGVSGGAITSGVGSGTNATYRVTFQAASSYTLRGLVLDFCAGSGGTPFIDDSNCPAPTNFTVGTTPTIDTTNYTVGGTTTNGLGSGWTASSVNSGQTFKITNSTGIALTSGTSYTFAISGITNTSTAGSFYARLVTYVSDTGGVATYSHGNSGTYQDYGGFALSMANIVQVTAKVQETLVFCMLGSTDPVTPTSPTSCTDSAATQPAITLGHGNNNTLDQFFVDKNYVYSYTSTNALNGAIVRIHNGNSCGGLKINGSATCGIPAVNSGAGTTPPGAMTAGTAAFGLSVSSNANTTASAPYDGNPATDYYGMDTTTTGANATTTFGSQVIRSVSPINNVGNTWSFWRYSQRDYPGWNLPSQHRGDCYRYVLIIYCQ